jgi:uncharacterized hydrophobic protein (TIGR00271 family)
VGLAVASILALTAPATTDPPRRVALALCVAGAALGVAGLATKGIWAVGLAAVLAAGGMALLDDPDGNASFVTWSLGAGFVGLAVAAGWFAGDRPRKRLALVVVGAGFGVAVAALVVSFDRQMLPFCLGLGFAAAASAVALGVVDIGRGDPSVGRVGVARAVHASGRRLRAHADATAGPQTVIDLHYDGPDRTQRLTRFLSLMALASTIGALGVLADSTAVVIGAMLIAPLMSPLMATSHALVTGHAARVRSAATISLGGACIPAATGFLVTAVAGHGTDVTLNTQIVSRSNPTLLDLAIALAAGAAGAYAASRSDVADSLPGAAIAIALVPPLAVAGAAAQLGALELFLTNAIAIIGVGALTFAALGATDAERAERRPVGRWVLSFGALGLAITWVLVANSSAIAETGARRSIAHDTVQRWIDDQDYEVTTVDLDGTTVHIELEGTELPTDPDALAEELARALGDDIELDLTVDLRAHATVDADGG